MELQLKRYHDTAHWPSLCWVARSDISKSRTLEVLAGFHVEATDEFIVEGVWPGAFAQGGFDRSSRFFGSGIRIRSDHVRFVSSCSTVDRLWAHRDGSAFHVSNSLPALLGVAGAALQPTETRYAQWIESIVRGRDYVSAFPVDRGELTVHYVEDLELRGHHVVAVPKVDDDQCFEDFATYRSFMHGTAEGIGSNACDHRRRYPIEVISTISRGYDSPVAALMAKAAGARRTLTLTRARSLLPRKDSGKEIAERLGLTCQEFAVDSASMTENELFYWSANGTMQDMNLTAFELPAKPAILMTGFNGDQVWTKGPAPADSLVRKDSTGMGYCEHRLILGVVHCPVPYWSIAQLATIRALATSAEMAPWTLGGSYDRPIPRRLLEECGVPRHLFGTVKGATSVDERLLWPLRPGDAESFRSYLSENSLPQPSWQVFSSGRSLIDLWRGAGRARLLDGLSRIGVHPVWRAGYPWERYLFPWAIMVRAQHFRSCVN